MGKHSKEYDGWFLFWAALIMFLIIWIFANKRGVSIWEWW